MNRKMRIATTAVLSAPGLGILVVAVATTLALPANATNPLTAATGTTAHTSAAGPAAKSLCYSQLDDDNGTGVVSQNFEDSLNAYDSQAADDFTLTKKCTIKHIYLDGTYLDGPGPCSSFTVTIYHDSAGQPAAIIGFGDSDRDGGDKKRHTITAKKPIKLPPGTYWLSAACNMDYATGGEFVWDTNNTVRGYASQWQNPADGLGTDCTTYTTTTTCIPSGEGGDFSFAVGN